jgi:hypothetical protein
VEKQEGSFFVRLLMGACAVALSAHAQVGYTSIQKPLPGNVVSEGFECCAVQEFGDGVHLATIGGKIGQVSVVLSSWACKGGSWVSDCVTGPPGPNTFKQPITINIYGVDDAGNPAGSLGSVTDTYEIPYRPTSTPDLCGGDTQVWYSKKDDACYHGIATQISANFSHLHIAVPSNNKIIATVSFNTTDFGPSPIGPSACRSTAAGCPYDSLNVSADGNGGTVGSTLDPNGIYVRPAGTPYPYQSCGGTLIPGNLALDTGCWAGYHPQIQIQVDGAKPQPKKGRP